MSKEYDNYLKGHIVAVRKAANWMAVNLAAVKELSGADASVFLMNAALHDSSKWEDAEYRPYDAYFYGKKDEDAFSLAWLHHIHHNPHHWQHWLLMNDDGKYRDPNKVVALEMVADWWSFSWRSGNLSEVFDWYEAHKDSIILHPSTREYVEAVLGEIRERIGSDGE